ncbi:MAG: phasin family protein [Pseudomonadota bacterium]
MTDIDTTISETSPPKATPNGADHPAPSQKPVAVKAAAAEEDKPSTVRRTVRKAPAKPAAAATKTPKKDAVTKAAKEIASPTAASASFVMGNFTELVDRARDRYERLSSEFSSGADALREGADEASEALRTSTEAARDGARDLSNHIAEMTQDEITKTLDFANGAVKCKSVSELIELQTDFFTGLLERRLEQFRDLNTKSMDTALKTFEPWSGGVSAALERATVFKRTSK